MVPLYLAKVEDLGAGDFVKIDCAACGHTALLRPASLARLGFGARLKVLDLGAGGAVSKAERWYAIKWAREAR